MGSEHEANGLSLSLFGPAGFRGAAARRRRRRDRRSASRSRRPGFLAGPLPAGSVGRSSSPPARSSTTAAETGYLEYHLEATATARGSGDEPRPPAASVVRRPRKSAARRTVRGWYRGDLHSHTVHSDGDDHRRGSRPWRGRARPRLPGDHGPQHDQPPSRESIAGRTGSPRSGPARSRPSTATSTASGSDQVIDWRDDRRGGGAARIAEQAHRQGALISINHPSAFGDPWCVGCHWDFAQVDYATIDAIEVWNGRLGRSPRRTTTARSRSGRTCSTRASGPPRYPGRTATRPRRTSTSALPMNYVYADRSQRGGDPRRHPPRTRLPVVGADRVVPGPGSDGVEVILPGAVLPADGALRSDRGRRAGWRRRRRSGSSRPVRRSPLATCDPGPRESSRDVSSSASSWWRLELRRGPLPMATCWR